MRIRFWIRSFQQFYDDAKSSRVSLRGLLLLSLEVIPLISLGNFTFVDLGIVLVVTSASSLPFALAFDLTASLLQEQVIISSFQLAYPLSLSSSKYLFHSLSLSIGFSRFGSYLLMDACA